VERDTFIEADLEDEDLFIKTDSMQKGKIAVFVYDRTDDDQHLSALYINLKDYSYHIGKCTQPGKWPKFTVSPATDDKDEIWKISESVNGLEISCNGVRVLEFYFANAYQQNCNSRWNLDSARIKFGPEDTASKSYVLIGRKTLGRLL
jgi:hypothetical protein